MRVLANRRGFSLVELLTVIAIIAILASIIFPVMGLVGNKARMNKCMTQLHQIGLAVQMFKQDNRKYPDILGTEIMTRTVGGTTTVVPMDEPAPSPNPTAVGLFPEYVKAGRLYHCPMSKFIDTRIPISTLVVNLQDYNPIGTGGLDTYAYNSYDFMIYGNQIREHYAKAWAADIAGVDIGTMANAPGDDQHDYERQLKFRTPPDDTVVTWCSWHEIWTGAPASPAVSGKAPVLFLDGHADVLEAVAVENFRYRVQPKKE